MQWSKMSFQRKKGALTFVIEQKLQRDITEAETKAILNIKDDEAGKILVEKLGSMTVFKKFPPKEELEVELTRLMYHT